MKRFVVLGIALALGLLAAISMTGQASAHTVHPACCSDGAIPSV
jgi:hypothetical protein